MLKKLGFQSSNKDSDPTTHNDNDKKESSHKKNKKPLRASASYDSMDSASLALRPHRPSAIYDPNPFPLDPTQPDGVSRHNVFSSNHMRREIREIETREVDIEIEETKGFVSGKSRQSIDLDHIHANRSKYVREELENDDLEIKYALVNKSQGNNSKNAVTRFGEGLKGALVKTGMSKTQKKDKEKDRVSNRETAERPQVDAVLQHHLQLQQQQQQIHIEQQEQQYREQRYAQEQQEISSRGHRGRPRERQRTQSGPLHLQNASGQSRVGGRGSRFRGEDSMSPSYHKEGRDPFSDHRSRLHSLSPPPTPGQEQRGSVTYWPDGREGTHPDDQEQSPFLPQTSSHHRSRNQQQRRNERSRPVNHTSDSEYGELSQHPREDHRYFRERQESDRIRRDAMGPTSGGGQRRQSGLYQVTNADSTSRVSSEVGEEEKPAAREAQRPIPDRLSRAREWVASHSKNNSIATPAPVMDREAALASLPGAFPSRSPHRRSMDSFEDYGVITPPRGSYFTNAGRSSGGYDPRERFMIADQMRMQELQRSGYRSSMTDDDGNYWNRQLEGYDQRDRYRQSRIDYGYDAGQVAGGLYYGYPPGGPDDPDQYDETESTLAPGSAVGGITSGKVGIEKQADPTKKVGSDGQTPLQSKPEDEESFGMQPKAPNKRRLILRLISLSSSILALGLLIAASPVSKHSSPFSSQAGLAFHYVVAIFSALVSFAFVFNYFSRRLRRQEKMKRYILFGLDILMSLLWLIDVFVCISKFPCGVGQLDGWCDMYNSSVFLGIVAFLSFLAAFIWDIWGSFDHSNSKIFGKGPWIKPPPPGWGSTPSSGIRQQGVQPGARLGGQGQMPGQMPGTSKPKNSKALW
ncbi:hypothetical protein FBU30_005771 [Linnemannia zychae]|nr:hypothetical protein FBU30_005771 [Linnemannia zychae]